MNTLYTIIGLFIAGALVGVYLLSFILRNKETPKFAAVVHGGFVVIALSMLIIYANKKGPGLLESIILFLMAAFSGLILIYRDLTGRPIPRWLAILHGLIAISGFVFLLAYTFYDWKGML